MVAALAAIGQLYFSKNYMVPLSIYAIVASGRFLEVTKARYSVRFTHVTFLVGALHLVLLLTAIVCIASTGGGLTRQVVMGVSLADSGFVGRCPYYKSFGCEGGQITLGSSCVVFIVEVSVGPPAVPEAHFADWFLCGVLPSTGAARLAERAHREEQGCSAGRGGTEKGGGG